MAEGGEDMPEIKVEVEGTILSFLMSAIGIHNPFNILQKFKELLSRP